mmetsp:Transcript_93069/g.290107  ORF Transcript_93069/g.290107 Transcript_93069/m.290107 type:complete len:403 (+) Transcript_93069:91-1299(+)
MKRGADGADGVWGTARKYGRGSGSGVPKARHVFKALVPDSLAANLLGSRGAGKDEIQSETGTKIVFSSRGDYFPSSSFRVMGIYADEASCIVGAFGWILPKIIDLGEEERKNPPKDGPEMLGKEPGEYVFRFCITKRMTSHIIGTGGSNIKQIRADTGAKCFIDNEVHQDHQLCRVIGQPEQILPALERVNEFIQQECEEQDSFQQYSSVLNFGEGAESGGGGGGGWAALPPSERPVVVPPPKRLDPSGEGGGGGDVPPGPAAQEEVDVLADVLGAFPPGTAQLQYSVSAELPPAQLGALLDQAGEYVKHIEEATSTTIEIEGEGADADAPRPMTIVGSLASVYAAHSMMLMKLRVLEAQEREEARRREEEQSEDPAVLKARIQELQAQLAAVTSQLQAVAS